MICAPKEKLPSGALLFHREAQAADPGVQAAAVHPVDSPAEEDHRAEVVPQVGGRTKMKDPESLSELEDFAREYPDF